jgi:hypothetical protein
MIVMKDKDSNERIASIEGMNKKVGRKKWSEQHSCDEEVSEDWKDRKIIDRMSCRRNNTNVFLKDIL